MAELRGQALIDSLFGNDLRGQSLLEELEKKDKRQRATSLLGKLQSRLEGKFEAGEIGQKPGFFERTGKDLKERGGKLKETFEKTISGEISPVETGIRTAGQAIAGAGDVLFQGLRSGFSLITPNFIEKPLKEKLKNLGTDFLKTNIGQKAMNAIGSGMASWEKFRKENPRIATNVESIVNISELFPIQKGLGVGSRGLKATREVAGKGAEALEKRLASQVSKEAIEIVKPKLSTAEKGARLAAGGGDVSGLPGLKKVELAPTAIDIRVAKAVENVVSDRKNPIENINAIREKIGEVARITDEGLKNNDAIFNNKTLRSALEKTKEESRIIFGGEKSLEKAYDTVMDEMFNQLGKQKNNLSGLLQARKDFDKLIKQKFPKIFDKIGGDNVRSNAVMDVRRAVNDFIEVKLPEGNPFKSQLKQQSDMYIAAKNISENTAKLVDIGATQRVISLLRQSPVVAGVTGGILTFGALQGLLVNPLVLGSLLTIGTVKVGKEIITSKALKRGLIKILNAIDNGVIKSTNSVLDKQAIQGIVDSIKE